MDEDLKKAGEALDKAIQNSLSEFKYGKEKEYLSQKLNESLGSSLQPFLDDLKVGILDAVKDIKISLDPIQIPEIKLPDIVVPEIKVPEVNTTVQVPEIKLPIFNIPEIKIPEIRLPAINVPIPQVHYTPPAITVPEIKMPEEMNVRGWVQLMGVNLENPLPVQLRDANGKPINLGGSNIITGGSGGHQKSIEVKDIQSSTGTSLINSDGRLQVSISNDTVPVSAGTSLTVDQLSGATWSVNVVGASASSAVVQVNTEGTAYNRDNPQPVIQGFSFVNVTAASATTTVKSGAGYLHTLTINSRGTASTVKLYDNTSDNGNLIATIDTTLSTTAFLYDIYFSSGLLAVTASGAAADLTISYL